MLQYLLLAAAKKYEIQGQIAIISLETQTTYYNYDKKKTIKGNMCGTIHTVT